MAEAGFITAQNHVEIDMGELSSRSNKEVYSDQREEDVIAVAGVLVGSTFTTKSDLGRMSQVCIL